MRPFRVTTEISPTCLFIMLKSTVHLGAAI
jgi:hypothetical protein